jgi:hypothetical protein
MGVALFLLLNISQPRRLIQLNKVSYIASRTLAENTRCSGTRSTNIDLELKSRR